MFSSKSSSKSNLRRVFLFLRRKFDFEDNLEENIRRSNLSALGKSPCVYIRRSKLLHRKNPCVVQQHFCPQQHFCQPRASLASLLGDPSYSRLQSLEPPGSSSSRSGSVTLTYRVRVRPIQLISKRVRTN